MQKYGFAGLTQGLDLSKDNAGLLGQIGNLNSKLLPARVTDIILDNNHSRFEEYGNWNSIGIIEFELLDKPLNKSKKPKAYPYFSNIKNYPLVNEIVSIILLPDRNINEVSNLTTYYYLPPINLWNNQHHNAYPNPLDKGEMTFNSPSNGGTFIERTNIHPLLPFSGDNIFEGRFGNSIRLGSTARNGFNDWSSVGENGDPILIIRNGQPLNSTNEAWTPQIEDINNDLSSIWITSTQQIPINTSYENYASFNTPPVLPRVYKQPQILLSADRLIFNAKKDGIILSGQNFISLNSNKDIGINAKHSFIVNSSRISLGDKEASQQIILGNKLLEQLGQLTQSLINITQTLEDTLQSWPGGLPAPHPANIPLSIQKDILQDILNIIQSDKLLSKVSRTI